MKVKVKMKLTQDEISKYKEYKENIRKARTKNEVTLWTNKAKNILQTGQRRYISILEGKYAGMKGVKLSPLPDGPNAVEGTGYKRT